ncbi:RNA-binding S4 domain-containing protein [Methylobacterium aquaticum]|uniref:RNA-binding S4 domain-containing protein n=1 Tax=Methylobacterium aquaticum TaxID=270351 RepID=A0A0C6FF84_9HYPH|nr:RNA-binding S4 domain-containing protein [Methylobacterium aquaticum]
MRVRPGSRNRPRPLGSNRHRASRRRRLGCVPRSGPHRWELRCRVPRRARDRLARPGRGMSEVTRARPPRAAGASRPGRRGRGVAPPGRRARRAGPEPGRARGSWTAEPAVRRRLATVRRRSRQAPTQAAARDRAVGRSRRPPVRRSLRRPARGERPRSSQAARRRVRRMSRVPDRSRRRCATPPRVPQGRVRVAEPARTSRRAPDRVMTTRRPVRRRASTRCRTRPVPGSWRRPPGTQPERPQRRPRRAAAPERQAWSRVQPARPNRPRQRRPGAARPWRTHRLRARPGRGRAAPDPVRRPGPRTAPERTRPAPSRGGPPRPGRNGFPARSPRRPAARPRRRRGPAADPSAPERRQPRDAGPGPRPGGPRRRPGRVSQCRDASATRWRRRVQRATNRPGRECRAREPRARDRPAGTRPGRTSARPAPRRRRGSASRDRPGRPPPRVRPGQKRGGPGLRGAPWPAGPASPPAAGGHPVRWAGERAPRRPAGRARRQPVAPRRTGGRPEPSRRGWAARQERPAAQSRRRPGCPAPGRPGSARPPGRRPAPSGRRCPGRPGGRGSRRPGRRGARRGRPRAAPARPARGRRRRRPGCRHPARRVAPAVRGFRGTRARSRIRGRRRGGPARRRCGHRRDASADPAAWRREGSRVVGPVDHPIDPRERLLRAGDRGGLGNRAAGGGRLGGGRRRRAAADLASGGERGVEEREVGRGETGPVDAAQGLEPLLVAALGDDQGGGAVEPAPGGGLSVGTGEADRPLGREDRGLAPALVEPGPGDQEVEVAPLARLDLVEHALELGDAGAVAVEVEPGQRRGEALAEVAGIDRAAEPPQILDRQDLEALGVAALRVDEDLAAQRALLHQGAGGEEPREVEELDRPAGRLPHRHRRLGQGELAGEAGGLGPGIVAAEQGARLALPALQVGERADHQGRVALGQLARLDHPPQHGRTAAAQREDDRRPQVLGRRPGLGFEGEQALLDMAEELALGEVGLGRAAGDAVLQELQRAHQLDRQAAGRHRQGLDRLGRLAVAAAAMSATPAPAPAMRVGRRRAVPVAAGMRRRRGRDEAGRDEPGQEQTGGREGPQPPHSGSPRTRISMRRFSAAFGSAVLRGARSA